MIVNRFLTLAAALNENAHECESFYAVSLVRVELSKAGNARQNWKPGTTYLIGSLVAAGRQ